jgi:hypothetical protein
MLRPHLDRLKHTYNTTYHDGGQSVCVENALQSLEALLAFREQTKKNSRRLHNRGIEVQM